MTKGVSQDENRKARPAVGVSRLTLAPFAAKGPPQPGSPRGAGSREKSMKIQRTTTREDTVDPVSGSPRLIEAQKTKHTITDGQGHPLRISLHPALRPAALSVPGAWVDSVSKLEGGSDLVAHTIFSASLHWGTRRVLDHPLEWALLWAVPADQPLAF